MKTQNIIPAVTIRNKSYLVSELENNRTQKVVDLLFLYAKCPNCHADLFCKNEDMTEMEQVAFIYTVNFDKSAFKELCKIEQKPKKQIETLNEVFYLKADKEKVLPLTREKFNALVNNKKMLLGDIKGSEGKYGSWDAECFFNYYDVDEPEPILTEEEKEKLIKIWEL